MGTSNWESITYCVDIIRNINPKRILDIGVGYGRWGMICREFLDVWEGKVTRENWTVHIDGVEAFEGNIDGYHKYFYNNIYIMDAKDYIKNCKKIYDLIIFGDVLEHFSKEDGKEVLDRALSISNYALINIPIGEHWEQDEMYGNKYEEHKSIWNESDFENYKIIRKRIINDHLKRKYATFIIAKNINIDNELMKPKKIELEYKLTETYVKDIEEYMSSLFELKKNREEVITKLIIEGEKLIMNKSVEQRNNVIIKVLDKNVNAQGAEVWIHNIKTNLVEAMNLSKIKVDSLWQIRESDESPVNKCLISSSIGAEAQFQIVGDTLELLCLSHAWSGKIQIINNGKEIKVIDLFSNINKLVNVKINLKEE